MPVPRKPRRTGFRWLTEDEFRSTEGRSHRSVAKPRTSSLPGFRPLRLSRRSRHSVISVPDPEFRYLIRPQKYADMFRREFTSQVPIRREQLASARGKKGRIRTNSLYFSLFAGNPAGETGSQLTASSASPFATNILCAVAHAQRSPITAGLRAQTSGLQKRGNDPKFVLFTRLSPNLRTLPI